jgi:predicted NBD/HSP70 family sugar kinase
VEDVVASGEPAYRSVVENVGDRLGQDVSRMVGVLDPQLIVLGWPTVELVGSRFGDSVVRAPRAASLQVRPLARVELSSIGADAGPVGAAALVLHDAYAPGMQRLSL